MKIVGVGTSLAAQWLRFCASHVGGMDLIPGQGSKILHAVWPQRIFFFFKKVFVGRKKDMLRAENRAEELSVKLGVRMWDIQKVKYQKTKN